MKSQVEGYSLDAHVSTLICVNDYFSNHHIDNNIGLPPALLSSSFEEVLIISSPILSLKDLFYDEKCDWQVMDSKEVYVLDIHVSTSSCVDYYYCINQNDNNNGSSSALLSTILSSFVQVCYNNGNMMLDIALVLLSTMIYGTVLLLLLESISVSSSIMISILSLKDLFYDENCDWQLIDSK